MIDKPLEVGSPMPLPVCPNLDALILRDDFDVIDESGGRESSYRETVEINCFERGNFFFEALRKPDFQRETSSWSPVQVRDFIRTFLDGDLVPAVILWKSRGDTFVIDGAHRLSALIAWVQDDYGDGNLSREFFGAEGIAPGQRQIAEETRALIEKTIGSYRTYLEAARNPSKNSQEIVEISKRLGQVGIKAQWVKGDSKKAEESFMKINQSAVAIDNTELDIIKSRTKPTGLATRAVIHAGRGHKYWSAFSESVQREIEKLAKSIYEMLFEPHTSGPIKSLDLPVAGTGYSQESLRLVYEFISIVNSKWSDPNRTGSRRRQKPKDDEDKDGKMTISYLKKCRAVAQLLSTNDPCSLGLHPAIYFYTATGNYQPSAFFAVVAFVQEMDQKRKLLDFTRSRFKFEEFLLKHQYLINQTVTNAGGWEKSVNPLWRLFERILSCIQQGKGEGEILSSLEAERNYYKRMTNEDRQRGANFSKSTKNAVVLKALLRGSPRCNICGCRIHFKSISVDHVKRKQDGGTGTEDNAQLTHPFCNTGFKEATHALEKKER